MKTKKQDKKQVDSEKEIKRLDKAIRILTREYKVCRKCTDLDNPDRKVYLFYDSDFSESPVCLFDPYNNFASKEYTKNVPDYTYDPSSNKIHYEGFAGSDFIMENYEVSKIYTQEEIAMVFSETVEIISQCRNRLCNENLKRTIRRIIKEEGSKL